jgi:hypothetical protein
MPEGYEGAGGGDGRLGDQDQARRRRGASAEGLGASREGRGRGADREGLGIVPRRRRGQRPGGGRPGQRPRRDVAEAPRETETPPAEAQAEVADLAPEPTPGATLEPAPAEVAPEPTPEAVPEQEPTGEGES